MKKLNITKDKFTESKYFTTKYGKLEYVSESGKLFKTSKGKILKFKESGNIVKESVDTLATPENVKVDDILYCTSYYDYQIQTFYKVLAKRGASTIVIQRVEKKYDGTQSDGVAIPSDKVDSDYNPITVRYGKHGFKVSGGKLYIWDGSPLEEYNYSESDKKFGMKFKESQNDVTIDDFRRMYGNNAAEALIKYCDVKKKDAESVINGSDADMARFENWAKKVLHVDIYDKFSGYDYDSDLDDSRSEIDTESTKKLMERVGDVSSDPAYVCPYCGNRDCEFDDAESYPNEGYFDGATFNSQFWCNRCNKPYNVTYELKVKDVYPNEDADSLDYDV